MSAGGCARKKDPALEYVDALASYFRGLSTDKAKRNLAAIAAMPAGRESVEQALERVRAWRPVLAQATRALDKAEPVLVKALRSKAGIRA